ncbi:MAG: DUF3309 family protein [Beijerinckiaceae bacterium]
MSTLLIILLAILLIAAIPTWPYSSSWALARCIPARRRVIVLRTRAARLMEAVRLPGRT